MSPQHYSLRWNNHQNHILNAFDTLLQSETLVDVTLVCEETSVRAHKVVLSACSPYFQRIFSENPCKHPIIVLKDLRGWEVQAIVDFMYKGEISVVQDQLQSLIKAAESLQVRGLTQTEHFSPEKEACGLQGNPFASSPSLNMHRGPGRPFLAPGDKERLSVSPLSPSNFDCSMKIAPHAENPPHPDQRHRENDKDRGSPIPRRKQARPMRRSGEVQGEPQDLSKNAKSSVADVPENLSTKNLFSFNNINSNSNISSSNNSGFINDNCSNNNGNNINNNSGNHNMHCSDSKTYANISSGSNNNNNNSSYNNNNNSKNSNSISMNIGECKSHANFPHSPSQVAPFHSKPENQSEPEVESHERDSVEIQGGSDDFLMKSESVNLASMHPSDSAIENAGFLPIPSLSALSMTPPHLFSLDQQLGLFPGLDACRNPLISDLPDHRAENHLISKRKMGRPKGQHSAPRGGPPRSWTNAELTEALQHVWNKKMTTSQASRIFGIPYNSLLMYVRGKYGKSLKLEQLKKDCLGGPGGPLDLLGLNPSPGNNNNNNNNSSNNNNNHPPLKANSEDGGPGTRAADHETSLPPGFNPYAAPNFYPDFGPPFPVPVSMIHLLPQSEKSRELFVQSEKAREWFHQAEKTRELLHQADKTFFAQSLPFPQDLSSPESREEDFRGMRSKSRDNNNGSSVEGSPVASLKNEPQLIENGSEN